MSARPGPIAPMLARSTTTLPAGEMPGDWVFEPKYDGVRAIAYVAYDPDADADAPPAVALLTRNGNDKRAQFPEVVSALHRLARRVRRDLVLDGEIVALASAAGDGDGPGGDGALARFQALQARLHLVHPETIARLAAEAPAVFVAFDCLLDGHERLTGQSWTLRRARLERLLAQRGRPSARARHRRGAAPRLGVRLGEAYRGGGEALLERARREGWEGIVAKHADAPYEAGRRSGAWRKLKVERRQEFVVGGWTEPRNTREHFGALLLGVFEGRALAYAGSVGTGFDGATLRALAARLARLERATPAFRDPPLTSEPAHWAAPALVVEVRFNEWTADGRLRQPVFVGVRDDVPARHVVREPDALAG